MSFSRLTTYLMFFSGTVIAQDVVLLGSSTHLIHLSTNSSLHKTQTKPISLMKFHLSPKAKQSLNHKIIQALPRSNKSYSQEQSNIQLDMAGIPVLDQGHYGTCVTFAITAAINALIKKGDYISQLCSLQLGNYLARNGYIPSGWDGSDGKTVLSQMTIFGLINKTSEHTYGCGNLNAYPTDRNATVPTTDMSPEAFRAMSEPLNSGFIAWSTLADEESIYTDKTNLNELLAEVKNALNAGDRLVFGTLLPDADLGTAGAVGKHNTTNDTWILTSQITNDMHDKTEIDGHEMVITGYNDQAVAYDQDGLPHYGLLTLRNSWGSQAGDNGNFYMSYQYFTTLVLEVLRIRSIDE